MEWVAWEVFVFFVWFPCFGFYVFVFVNVFRCDRSDVMVGSPNPSTSRFLLIFNLFMSPVFSVSRLIGLSGFRVFVFGFSISLFSGVSVFRLFGLSLCLDLSCFRFIGLSFVRFLGLSFFVFSVSRSLGCSVSRSLGLSISLLF